MKIKKHKDFYDFEEIVQVIDNQELGMFVEIENTALKDSHFRWSWNNSFLSLVFGGPCIQRIVLNGDEGNWAYDPRKEVILKRYLRYSDRFQTIDRDIELCYRDEK